VRAGDRDALGRGLEAARESLLVYARQLLGNRAFRMTAEDLVQDVALRVSVRFRLFRGSSFGEWESWLRTILKRRFLDRAPDDLGRLVGPADVRFGERAGSSGASSRCAQARRR
jgi:DNA-directed RNA polymerase specialized sigma24 family protein